MPELTPHDFVSKWRHYPQTSEVSRDPRRTLTNLYNQRPTWLELAHKKLNQAVFAAYGWPSDLGDQ